MSDQSLFQPFALGDLTLRNRIVLAPMTRARSGTDRLANSINAKYYAQRSSAGLIVTEGTTISEEANGWGESPGIYSDKMAEAWKPVVDAVHEKQGVIFLQLWHCGRASHSSFQNGKLPVAPSAIKLNGDYVHTPTGKQPYEVPRALETAEIPRVVGDYQQAAERAKKAGFDGVEIHGANGYLIDEFLQSKTNHRTDQYGGSIENRFQFLKEVVKAVTSVWSVNKVGVRLSPNGVYNDMGSPDYREQFTYTEATATQAVSAGYADLIAFGRPYISNPDLVERFQKGLPLAETAPMSDWYSPTGEKGYTDFPSYSANHA